MIRNATLLAALLYCTAASAADWPAWRGPDGQGHSTEKDLPLKWGPSENVHWKIALPDEGNSTPIVCKDRIFLTQATDKGTRRSLWCLSRSDGKRLWQKDVEYKDKESTHNTNPYCSASPVTDGERVVVSHGSAGMYCYDFDGNEKWKYDTGKMEHIWGNASSPILHGDLAILWCGPGERQFLLAVNKKTGEKVWQYDEAGGKSGTGGGSDWIGSWSTPIVVKVGDHDELILSMPLKLRGFDPKTGKELWWCDGLGKLVYTSPLYADGIVVAMSGYGGPALAVKLGGSGDITKDRLWHHTKGNPQRVGSGVIVGEHVYILSEPGLAQCFELKTGKEVWGSQRAGSRSWGSMVAAGARLYVTNQDGTTYVFTANPKYEEPAVNKLGEHVNASIAVADGELYIRTYKNLWCIKGNAN
jgi:outer membrane protein assembly factor BamB